MVEARAKLEEELKLARQRIEELVAAKQIEPQRYAPSSSRSKGFELKFHEPREVEDKLTVVMTVSNNACSMPCLNGHHCRTATVARLSPSMS